MFCSNSPLRLACFLAAALAVPSVFAQEDQQTGPHVRIVVSAEQRDHAVELPQIKREDVLAYQNDQRIQVADWAPLRGAGLQLWVLIDDGTDSSLGIQLEDLRKFVRNQPDTTQIGIGYLRNGTADVVHNFTTDHESAAKSIRLPVGIPGVSASPYLALTDVIRKWQPSSQAHEILLVSSGIDPYYGPGPDDPYLAQAIDAAQRAGVVVHSIYYSGVGHLGHSYWQIQWGQNDLSQICEETGGEFYWQGSFNPVSFEPFLQSLSDRLSKQYLATLIPKPRPKSGFERFKIRVEVPHVTLAGPSKIYVPGAR